MHFSKVLFLYGFLLTFTTASPTPAASPLPLDSSALAFHNATLLPRGGKLSYIARAQVAELFPGLSGSSRLAPLHRPLCSGSEKIFCEKTCRCNNIHVIYCGVFTDAEVTAFSVSTHNSATAMASFRDQAMTTCQPSCRCDPGAKSGTEDIEEDERGRWKKRITKDAVRRSDHGSSRTPSSSSPPEIELCSANPSRALQPRTDAGQSAPDLLPASSSLLWVDKTFRLTQCNGVNRVDCQNCCYCTLSGTVECDMRSSITYKSLLKSMEGSKANDLVNQRAKRMTDSCRPVCRCEKGPSKSSKPVKESKERKREERERGKKARTSDIRKESRNQIMDPLGPPSSTSNSNVQNGNTSPILLSSSLSLQARNDAEPSSSKEKLVPAPAWPPPPVWLPPPRFARPKPLKEIFCSGKDKPYCKDRCGCNSDGTLLCTKKFQAGLQSLVGVAEREMALDLVIQQMAGVVAKCGLVCHCGDGISEMGLGALGLGDGTGTRAGFGGVGVGPKFRTKVVGREGMTHGKAILKRTADTAPPPLRVLSSLPSHMIVGNSAASPLSASGRFPRVTCHSNPKSKQFCIQRCFCTTAEHVSCKMLEGAQIAALLRHGFSSTEARFTAKLLTEDATEGCVSVCACPAKGDPSGRKPLEKLPESLFYRFSEISASSGSTLQPRSGGGSSTEFPDLGLPTFTPASGALTGLTCGVFFMDYNFCDTRCRCTAFRTVVCDKLTQFQLDHWKKQKMSHAKAEAMVEEWTQQSTEKCATLCSCSGSMSGNKRKKGEVKRSIHTSNRLSPPSSPVNHSSPAAPRLRARTDASSATEMPPVVRSRSPFKGLEPGSPLRCTGHHPRGMDSRFCKARCQCNPAGRIYCEKDSRKKIAELMKKKPWSRETAELMTRKVEAVVTEECKAICTCEDGMESLPKENSVRKTREKTMTLPRPNSGPQDVSPIPFPILHPRSGLSPSTRGSSNRPVRISSPPSVKPKQHPELGKFLECYSSEQNLLDDCEARCYCTSTGSVKCDKLNEDAIDAATGSVTKEGIMTKEWATLLVTQHSERTLQNCEPICACHDKPGLGRYRTVNKPGMESPKGGSAKGGGSSIPQGIIIEYRDLSHSALGHLQPRSDAGFSTPRKGKSLQPPALDSHSPVKCRTSNMPYGWNARHCQARCYCTVMGEIICDIGSKEEIAGLTQSMELSNAKRFVSSNRKTITRECKRLCHCPPVDRTGKDTFYSPIRYHAATPKHPFQRRSGVRSYHSGSPALSASSPFQPGYAFRSMAPGPPLRCDDVAFRTNHCKARCQCTSGKGIFCTGNAGSEVVALAQTHGQQQAIEFVEMNRRTIEKECGEICTCTKQEPPKRTYPRSILPVNVSPNPSASSLSHTCFRGNNGRSEQGVQAGITGLAQGRIQARGDAPPSNEILPPPSPPVSSPLNTTLRDKYVVLKCKSDEELEAVCQRRCFCDPTANLDKIKCDILSQAMLVWMMRPDGSQGKSKMKPELFGMASSSQEKITKDCKAACSCTKLTTQHFRNETDEVRASPQAMAALLSEIEMHQATERKARTLVDNFRKMGIQRRSDTGHVNLQSIRPSQKSTPNTNAPISIVLKCWGAQESECRRRCVCKSGAIETDIDCDIGAEAKLQRLTAPGGPMKTGILPQLIAQIGRRREEITKECQSVCSCSEARPYRSFSTSRVDLMDPRFQSIIHQYRDQPHGDLHLRSDLHPRSDVAQSTLEGLSRPPTSPPTSPSNKGAIRLECNNHAKTQKCRHHCDCTSYETIQCHKNGPFEQLKSDEAMDTAEEDALTTTAEESKEIITRECIEACICRNTRKSLAATLSSMSLSSKSRTISKTKAKSKSGGRGEKMKEKGEGVPGRAARRELFPRNPPVASSSFISSPPTLTCAPPSSLSTNCLNQCRCAIDGNILCDLNLPAAIEGFRLRLPLHAADEQIRMYTSFMKSICTGPCNCGPNPVPGIAVNPSDVKVLHLNLKTSLNPIQPRGSPDRGFPDISSSPAASNIKLTCSGSESRYCEVDCYCSDEGTVKCDRKLPPVIKAFQGSMTKERAEVEQRRYVSDMENLCGHICRCVESKRKAESVLEHSHAIRPRSAAGPSSPVSPTIATADTFKTYDSICAGPDSTLCDKHCYCNIHHTFSCDRYTSQVAKSLNGVVSEGIMQFHVRDWVMKTTTTCRRSCRCERELSLPSQSTGKVGMKRKAVEQMSRPLQPRSGVGPSSSQVHPPARVSHSVGQLTCTGPDAKICTDHFICNEDGVVVCQREVSEVAALFVGSTSPEWADSYAKGWIARMTATCVGACHCAEGPGVVSHEKKRKATELPSAEGSGGAFKKWKAPEPPSRLHPRSDAGSANYFAPLRPATSSSQTMVKPPSRPIQPHSDMGLSTSRAPTCDGADRLMCISHCSCNQDGVVVCEQKILRIAAKYLHNTIPESADRFSREWIKKVTPQCRAICHCGEGSGEVERNGKVMGLHSSIQPRSDAGPSAIGLRSRLPATSISQSGVKPARPIRCAGPRKKRCEEHCICKSNPSAKDHISMQCSWQAKEAIAALTGLNTAKGVLTKEMATEKVMSSLDRDTVTCMTWCNCTDDADAWVANAEQDWAMLQKQVQVQSSSREEVSQNRLTSSAPPAAASELNIEAVESGGLPLQPRSAAGPSTAGIKPPLDPNIPAKKIVKITKPILRCGAEEEPKEIWCHDRCECSPEGRIVCTKKAAAAIKALTGTPSPKDGIIITKLMAEECIAHVSKNVAGLCSQICDCGKGPRGDTRERWRKQHRGGRNDEEFDEHITKPFIFSGKAKQDTAWTGKTKAQRDLLLSISHGTSPQPRSDIDASTNTSPSQPPKPSGLSAQRRSPAGPSMFVPLNQIHIECIDPMSHGCEDSCYCTPEGIISCNKNSARATKALTGTKVGTAVITAEMAEESVAAGAIKLAKKCGGFCHCADGPSKTGGGVYDKWKSRQRGSKVALEKARYLPRGLAGPSSSQPSSQPGKSPATYTEYTPYKYLECTKDRDGRCEPHCNCDPNTGIMTCGEEHNKMLARTWGNNMAKQQLEQFITAMVARATEMCSRFCQCVDRPTKRKGDMGEKWIENQPKAKKAAKATDDTTGLVARSLGAPSTSKGSSRTGSYSPSPPTFNIKPSKQMVCVDPKSHDCEASCRCDPDSGEITCDKKAEKAVAAMTGTSMTEEQAATQVKTRTIALTEKCSQFCYCIDKPGKSRSDKHEEWINKMQRGRKTGANGGYLAGHNPRSLPVNEVSSGVNANTTAEISPDANANVNTTASHLSPKPPAPLHARSTPNTPSSFSGSPSRFSSTLDDPSTPLTSLRTHTNAPSTGAKRLECLNRDVHDCDAKCYCLNDGTLACNKNPLTAIKAIMAIRKKDGSFVSPQEAEERLKVRTERLVQVCGRVCFCVETPKKGPVRGGMWGRSGRRVGLRGGE